MKILNKYYTKGLTAKRLFNHDNSHNPYPKRSREHLLWKLGNEDTIYEELDNEAFPMKYKGKKSLSGYFFNYMVELFR